ncbi:MAG: CHAP domain-containing protein [Bacteroidetes bacterium]|nr:CHAP domain-containing protein [Bacteroidota bacterium]
MAKSTLHCLFILLLLHPVCRCSAQGDLDRSCITHTYSSQLGVRELTGHNDGKDVEKYLHTCGLGKGYAWCAAFVKWCYIQCGINTTGITAWAATCINRNHIIYSQGRFTSEPLPGDNITFWDYYNKRVAHTGLYHRRVNETFYESVEGNTNGAGSAEGDGVYLKKRSFKATYIISRWTN